MSAKQISDTEANLLETILALAAELESIQVRVRRKTEEKRREERETRREERETRRAEQRRTEQISDLFRQKGVEEKGIVRK